MNTVEEDRHSLLQNIVGHHTGVSLDDHTAESTIHVSTQLLDLYLNQSSPLSHLRHFELHPNNTLSFI